MADPRPDPDIQLTQRLDTLALAGPTTVAMPTPVLAALRRRRFSRIARRAGATLSAIALAASVAVIGHRAPPTPPEPGRPSDRGLGSFASATPLPTAAALLDRYVRGEDTPAGPLTPSPDVFRLGDGLWAGPQRVAELASGV